MSLRNDIMRFSVLEFRSDTRIEFQAPVLTVTLSTRVDATLNVKQPSKYNKNALQNSKLVINIKLRINPVKRVYNKLSIAKIRIINKIGLRLMMQRLSD